MTRRKANRPSLVYCGDDAGSKEVAAGLIRDLGFEPVDTGPPGGSRTPFVISRTGTSSGRPT